LWDLPDRAEIRARANDHNGIFGSQSRHCLAEQLCRLPRRDPLSHVISTDHDQDGVRRINQGGVHLFIQPAASATADRQGLQLDRLAGVLGKLVGQHNPG
jgi:hypothetical protein